MNYKIILPNLDTPIKSSIFLNNHVSIEHVLGMYSDFNFGKTCKLDFIDFYPDHYKFIILYVDSEIKISQFEIDKINNDDKCFLLIWSTHEPYLQTKNIETYLEKNSINFKKVIIVSSDEQPNTKIKHVFADDWWEAFYRFHVLNYNLVSYIEPQKQTLNFTKKALCLNRNLRPHRIWNYHALIQTGLDTQCHLSYHLPIIEQDQKKYQEASVPSYNHVMDIARHSVPKKYLKSFNKNKKLYSTQSLDNLDFVYNYQNSIVPYYFDSAVSIVTESIMEKTFVTEKTFKPIVHSHPFICVANKGNYDYLKRNNYAFFPEIFGVEYIDNFETALRVYRNLKNTDHETLCYRLKSVQDKILHNWNNFIYRPLLLEDLMRSVYNLIDNSQ